MKERKISTYWFILALLAMLCMTASSFGGNLEPSAPPGPTMKTLDEVEPRIPIPHLPYTIDNPGSYYLSGDLQAPIGAGIIVSTDNATIDLMGYSLIGVGSGGGYGIYMEGRIDVEIRNGTVRNFGGDGIYDGGNGKGLRVIGVRAMSNGGQGIRLGGYGHLVKDCTAVDNQGNGISVGGGCTVTGNTAYNNQSSGISVGGGCTVTGNTVRNNQWYGIVASQICTVTGNTAFLNHRSGIIGGYGSTVTGNTVGDNNSYDSAVFSGIRVTDGCMVKGNTLQQNKRYNIYVWGSDNAIEENLMTDSTGYGIYFRTGGNFYANNRASGNSTNYGNTGGNTSGGGNVSF